MARELSEKNKAQRERDAQKREAVKTIIAYVDSNKESIEFPQEIIDAVATLKPKSRSGFGGVAKKVTNVDKVLELFGSEGDVIHEDDIFLKLKLGRTDMRQVSTKLVKRAPEDRIWIAFDADTGNYSKVAEGADMPEDWNGYVPEEFKQTETGGFMTTEFDDIDEDDELLEDVE